MVMRYNTGEAPAIAAIPQETKPMTTRRSFLAAALAGPVLAAAPFAASDAQAQAPVTVIGAIRVDVSRLQAQGWGSTALAIKLGLERELAQALGPHLRRGGGSTLNVAVRGVFLNSYAGGGGGRWGGGAEGGADSFDSEVTVLSRGNRIIATYPVLSTVPASSAGPWYLPDIDQRRMEGLIRVNAGWIKRYVLG
jgi:hypothetical protein